MKKITPLLFCIFIYSGLLATGNYNVANIADSLKKGVAVIRNNTVHYERISDKKYSKRVHYAVTILNKFGEDYASLSIPYDRNSSIKKISGTIYNAEGIPISSLTKNNFSDRASYAEYTFFSDSRIVYYNLPINSYPITIEYKYEIKHNALIGFDTFFPIPGYDISCEESQLSYTSKSEQDINYKEVNAEFKFSEISNGEIITYEWKSGPIQSIKKQVKAPPYYEFFPHILLSPKRFEYEGYSGDFSSWQSYGAWVNTLLQGRDEISEDLQVKMQALTSHLNTDAEKIDAVYKYVQSNTRYVNVALGIGGFQPMHASEVAEKGYGDCKALTNFTKALLKSIDIPSHYCEIGSGNYQSIRHKDFASANQTNHAILCVPNSGDTLWLECTNTYFPSGYLSKGCSDKGVLVVSSNGSFISRTYDFEDHKNLMIDSLSITVQKDLSCTFTHNKWFYESWYASFLAFHLDTERELKNYYNENTYPFETQNLSFNIVDCKDTARLGIIEAKGKMNNAIKKSGSLHFLPISFLKNSAPYIENHQRTLNYVQKHGFKKIRHTIIQLPKEITIGELPKNKKISNDFGSYTISYAFENAQTITITEEIAVHKGKYSVEQFDTIKQFEQDVYKSRLNKIVYTLK